MKHPLTITIELYQDDNDVFHAKYQRRYANEKHAKAMQYKDRDFCYLLTIIRDSTSYHLQYFNTREKD